MNTWVYQLPPIAKLFAACNSLFIFSGVTLKKDLIAGLTVSLVAIPQSLAYAQQPACGSTARPGVSLKTGTAA